MNRVDYVTVTKMAEGIMIPCPQYCVAPLGDTPDHSENWTWRNTAAEVRRGEACWQRVSLSIEGLGDFLLMRLMAYDNGNGIEDVALRMNTTEWERTC